jgi:hypothetical protein
VRETFPLTRQLPMLLVSSIHVDVMPLGPYARFPGHAYSLYILIPETQYIQIGKLSSLETAFELHNVVTDCWISSAASQAYPHSFLFSATPYHCTVTNEL